MGFFKADKAPPPPDYGPLIAASQAQAQTAAQTSKENLDWARQQWGEQKEMLQPVLEQQIRIGQENEQFANQQRQRYQETFQPLENQYVEEAQAYGSPQRKAAMVGAAQAQVSRNYEAQRAAAQQQLEGYGIDPSSTRSQALDVGARTAQAAASAAAGTGASNYVDQMKLALMQNAINMGQTDLAGATSAYGTALQGGQAATAGSNQGLQTGSSIMGSPTQWAGIGNQATGTAGNLMNQSSQNQIASFNAQQNASSGLGTLLGTGLGIGLAALNPTSGVSGAIGGLSNLLGGGSGGTKNSAKAAAAATGGPMPLPGQVTQGIPTGGLPPGSAVPPAASPSRGIETDDVPARLNAGEYVVPKDVAAWKGEEYFQKLIDQSRKAKGQASAKPQMRQAIPAPPTYVSPGARA